MSKLNKRDIKDLENALNCVYTDLNMLDDGSWVPDSDSINDTITMLTNIREIVEKAGLLPVGELTDIRED